MFLALDPGNVETAYVLFCSQKNTLIAKGILLNEQMLELVYSIKNNKSSNDVQVLVVEAIASYGMSVGKEIFDTCVWIGRFIEAWGGPVCRVYRKTVKMHLCGTMKAKDANIRQALIDRFGPGKEKAVGTKKAPGPLYGVSSDVWSALAVAVTYSESFPCGEEI